MKKPNPISDQDREFLEQLDALIGSAEPTAEELAADLEECGVDPKALKEATFQALRAYATANYSSKGAALPPLMSEALKQMRPPSPEEQAAARSERATSRVKSLLASLRGVGESLSSGQSFAPAFRNKQEGMPDSDKEILRQQQEELDQKTRRKAND